MDMRQIFCAVFHFGHPYEQISDNEGAYALVCTHCKRFECYTSVEDVEAKWIDRNKIRPGSASLAGYPSRRVESVKQELISMGINPEIDRPHTGADKTKYHMTRNGSPICSGKVVIMLRDRGESRNHSAKVKLIGKCDCVFGHVEGSTFSYRLEDLVPA